MTAGSLGAPELAFLALAAGALGAAALRIGARVGPVYLVAPGIALSVFSGNWNHVGVPIGIDRVLIGLGVLLALYRVLAPWRPERVELRPVHLVLVLLVGYALCSAVWSGAYERSDDVYLLLDKLGILPFTVFLLAPAIFPTRRERDVLLGALFIVALYLAWTGFAETVGLRSLVFPSYITDPAIGIHVDRVRGPFAESSGMGLGLYASIVVCAIVGVRTRDRRLRALAAVAVIALAVGLLGTVTRHVWLGAVLGTLAALGLVPALRRYVPAAIVGGAIVVLAAFQLVPGLQGQASNRTSSEQPVWDRLNSDHAALKMFEQRPLLGQGWGAFSERGLAYYERSEDYPLTQVAAVHNVVLGYLAELGVVGTLLWLVAFILAMRIGLRPAPTRELELWRIGLIALVVDWFTCAMLVPLGYAFPNMLLWAWAGIVWAGQQAATPPAPVPRARQPEPLRPAPVPAERPREPVLV